MRRGFGMLAANTIWIAPAAIRPKFTLGVPAGSRFRSRPAGAVEAAPLDGTQGGEAERDQLAQRRGLLVRVEASSGGGAIGVRSTPEPEGPQGTASGGAFGDFACGAAAPEAVSAHSAKRRRNAISQGELVTSFRLDG